MHPSFHNADVSMMLKEGSTPGAQSLQLPSVLSERLRTLGRSQHPPAILTKLLPGRERENLPPLGLGQQNTESLA